MTDCLFCRIAAGEIPASKVYEDEHCLAFYDINPPAPPHVLVIPKKHISKIAEASDDDSLLLGQLNRAACKVAAERGLTDFRLVVNNGAKAGQSVFHLHMHVIGGRDMSWPPG